MHLQLKGKTSMVRSTDGALIAYTSCGNAEGPAVLFVHGFSQARHAWWKQFADASLTGACLLAALDLRGHGDSDAPSAAVTPSQLADDIHAVASALPRKPVLVGWSFGGLAVLDYLHHYGTGVASKLMFVGAGHGSSTDSRRGTQFGPALTSHLPDMLSDEAAANVRGTMGFVAGCRTAVARSEETAFMLALNMLVTPRSRRALLEGRPQQPQDYEATLLPRLRSQGKPVRLVCGDNDQVILPASMGSMAQALGAPLTQYPGVGHMPFAEAAQRFNAELRGFVLAPQEA